MSPRDRKNTMNHTVTTVLATLVATFVVGVGCAYAFIYSGAYDVSATTPDSSLIYWATHKVSDESIAHRLGANVVPANLTDAAKIHSGGQIFLANCAVCHGGPGLKPTEIAQGLNPTPPDLFRATRHPDPQENFQFIKYGVKMTGMPAFATTHSDDQIWNIVAFLNTLPGITAADFATKTGAASGG
jgi:mono/diheme cytochrome c family protein